LPAVVEISIRMSETARDRLMDLCSKHGISVRAAFEACTLCAAPLWEKKKPSKAERELCEGLARVARQIVAEAEPRSVRINLRLEPEILARVKCIAERYELSVSAMMAATFYPWGSNWGSPDAYRLRAQVWRNAVGVAHRLDWERRMKRPVNLNCCQMTG
jgi:hypothetical protein